MEGDNIIENINNNLNDNESKQNDVVITEFMKKEGKTKINELCKDNSIGFIYISSLGIYSFCFVDLGDNFFI